MRSQTRVIMLVDDDPDFLSMQQHVFEALGYRVWCFRQVQAAMEKMSSEKPDLVITDVMMTALDSGFSFSERIKKDARFSGIPVIVVTAIGSRRGFNFRPRSPEDLAAIHADAFFEKPADTDVLVTKVRELLRQDDEGHSA